MEERNVPDTKVVKTTYAMSGKRPIDGIQIDRFVRNKVGKIISLPGKSVVLHSNMGIGDCCLFTIVLESLAKQYPDRFRCDVVGKYADQIFKNNPNVDKTVNHAFAHHIHFEHEGTIASRREMMDKASMTHQQACCDYVGEQLGIKLTAQFNRPVFYLTKKDQDKQIFANPFCFLNAGWKTDIEVKWYSRWQEVVNKLRQLYPRLLIIQIGANTDLPAFNKHNHPPLEGVIDMRGRWDGNAWDFICAANHAEFGMGPTSFIKHVFSGLGKPYVCVIPGDEPLTWTYSPGVTYIHRQGTIPCCRFGACYKHVWRDCRMLVDDRLPKCMDIPSDEVVNAVKAFVDGALIVRRLTGEPTRENQVMGPAEITIGTLYDDGMKELGDWTSATLREYAAKHNYNLVVAHRADPTREPSWSKILLVSQIFQGNPQCKWFFWLDADCKIRNLKVKLESLIDDDFDLIIGEDRIGDPECNHGHRLLNAGVFLIRNCPESLEFLGAVWNHPRKSPYYEDNFEQQAVREMAFATPGLRTKVIPRRKFNSFSDEWEPGDFIEHAARGTGGREKFAEEMKSAKR